MNYVWAFNALKVAEGGSGVADEVREVKRAKLPGVRARQTESCYVGHTRIVVGADNKVGLRKALRILKNYGMVESVKDEIHYAEEVLK